MIMFGVNCSKMWKMSLIQLVLNDEVMYEMSWFVLVILNSFVRSLNWINLTLFELKTWTFKYYDVLLK